MSRKIHLAIPMKKALRKLGQDISDARRRRRITMELMAERAGFSRITLSKIEKGEPSVSMGAYASALFVLGLTDNLRDLADSSHDLVGRALEEENLPKRVRLPRGSITAGRSISAGGEIKAQGNISAGAKKQGGDDER